MDITQCTFASCDRPGRVYQDPAKIGTQFMYFRLRRCNEHAPRTHDGRTMPADP